MPSQLLKLTLLLAGIICPSASLPIGGSENDFRPDTWENIPTSTDTIQWSRCPNSYDEDPSMRCARLKVPLDYEDPKAGTTTIAFMKYLAEHATATTQDILYNPGGPGGSGIGYLLMKKHQLRKALGMSHNIVAFDPRGIGHSGPNTDCFNGDDLAAYQFASTTYPEVISREKALNASFTNSNTWGNLCKTNLDTSAHYLGTPAVAQDLLTYVERDAATKQMDPEEAKVNFFGVSYGTVLGATFATLYPERVGKFVLDGVMQDEPWYLNGRQDTLAYQDEAISQFFSQCSEAGSARCSFWAGSAKQTEARYERLLETIERNPLRVPYSAVVVDVPIFITADTVRTAVFQASYHGHTSFRDLADRLADLERGFYKSWLGNGPGVAKIPTPSCSNCSLKDWNTLFETFPNSDSNKELFSPNAHSGIMCTDLVPQDIPSLEAYTEYMDTSWNSSHYAGFTGADLANCRSWPFRPPPSQRFNAKFGASLKQPMLVLTNTFDPVCPAAYARQVEHQFPGSVLLEQRAIGHGAATLGSACTEGHVRDYFETGRLPSPGTVCVPDKKPVLLQDVEIERNG